MERRRDARGWLDLHNHGLRVLPVSEKPQTWGSSLRILLRRQGSGKLLYIVKRMMQHYAVDCQATARHCSAQREDPEAAWPRVSRLHTPQPNRPLAEVDDSQLEYGARWYDDFAKAATNLRERPEPYPDVVYYLGKPEGYVDLMNQLGLSIHDAENKADALRYILSIPRASSI